MNMLISLLCGIAIIAATALYVWATIVDIIEMRKLTKRLKEDTDETLRRSHLLREVDNFFLRNIEQ